MPTIAFQGAPGAYSDLACRGVYPDWTTLPCRAFEDAFQAVHAGSADLAMIPVENSVAGRVADIHRLLPEGGLHIVGEHYQRVVHHLLALPGTALPDLSEVHSHIQGLSQCRGLIRALGLDPVVHADTAGAAKDVAAWGDRRKAAIASELAGRIYGLVSLKADIADGEHNTTRFVILSREPAVPPPDAGPTITTLFFRVRSVPAALYKALGGFATNGVNIVKLESYMVDGRFTAAQFHADVEGHPDDPAMRHALDELRFFAREVRVLGTYPAHPFRTETAAAAD
jgi:prephenate dehydratase